MNKVETVVAHITFILSICFITLWIFDYFNPMMNLLNNQITGKGLLILFAGAMYLGISEIIHRNKSVTE